MRIVSRDDASSLNENGVKNQWNWSWLEKKIELRIKETCPKASWRGDPVINVYVGAFMRKVFCLFFCLFLLISND